MKPNSLVPTHGKDPIELLILRILRRGFAKTVVTGAMGMAAGCGEGLGDRVEAEHEPALAADGAARDQTVAARDAAGAPIMDGSTPRVDVMAGPIDASRAPQGPPEDGGRRADGSVGEGADGGGDAGPSPFVCAPGSSTDMKASGLRPAEAFDYIAIRQVSGGFSDPDAGTAEHWTRENFINLSESGTACGAASSNECAAQIARHPAEFVQSYCVQACVEYSVVTTRGNEVKRWASAADVLALLGPIDSADEALLLTTRAGYRSGCAKAVADGYEVVAIHYKSTCPIVYERVTLHVSSAGSLRVGGAEELPSGPNTGACIGRVPAGLISESRARHESAIGDYLAQCAHLEDASVYAFEQLARELTTHRAPRALIAAALHAADDEVRHARVMAALARRHGGEPVSAEVQAPPARTLEQIAIENATEGCIRETYGALVGGYQARHATEPRVRAVMSEIAADEARHAALSHRVHSWALEQLDAHARERVRAEQVRALAELTQECALDTHAAVRDALGLPAPDVALAMLRELSSTLWKLPAQEAPRAQSESVRERSSTRV